MRRDKVEALELRKEGKSYSEITRALGVSKGTLSFWFKGFDWSQDLAKYNHVFNYSPEKILLMHKARGRKLGKLYEEMRIQAEQEFDLHKNETLFIAGLIAYAGEGDKTHDNLLRIANTDPRIHLIFKRFIEMYYPQFAEKLRVSILLYPDLDSSECLQWWSASLSIPVEQFHKPVRIIGRHKTRRLQYGVASLIISSTSFKVKIRRLLDLALENAAAIV